MDDTTALPEHDIRFTSMVPGANFGAFTGKLIPDVPDNQKRTLIVRDLPKGTLYVGVNLTELDAAGLPVARGPHFAVIATSVYGDGDVARVTYQRVGGAGTTPCQASVFWSK